MSSTTGGLLSGTPIKAILIKATGLEPGGSLAARVGLKTSTWEDRGSNDGAVSENATESGEATISWFVYNTFRRNPENLEMVLRVMTKNHRLVGKEVMGEVKVELRNVSQKQVKVMDVQLTITIGSEAIFNDTGVTPIPRSHPCGTNHHGMLPEGVEELNQKDLKSCTLWGGAHMPMTSWIACHFLYNGTPFRPGPILVKSPTSVPKVKDFKGDPVSASPSGAKAGHGVAQAPDKIISNAAPMLEIKRQRQGGDEVTSQLIADGVIINYLLIPALWPSKVTDDVLRWERKIGYQFIPAMWREFTGVDHAEAFRRTCPNYPATFTSRYSPIMRQPVAVVARNMHREMQILKDYIGLEFDPMEKDTSSAPKDNNKSFVTMKSIFTEFKNEMMQQMGKQDFMGGDKPNPTDISFYGVNILRFVTEVGPTRQLIEATGLLPWMYRMMDVLPPSKCLPMEYFGPSMEGWKGGWLMDPAQADPVKVPV